MEKCALTLGLVTLVFLACCEAPQNIAKCIVRHEQRVGASSGIMNLEFEAAGHRHIYISIRYTDVPSPPIYSDFGIIEEIRVMENGKSSILIPAMIRSGPKFIAEDFHPDRITLSSAKSGSYVIHIPYGVTGCLKQVEFRNFDFVQPSEGFSST